MDMKTTQAATTDDAWVPTVCAMCYNHCPILVHRVNGVAVKIEGNPTCPGTQGGTCPKGNAGIMKLYDQNRVKTPLKRTNPEKGVGIDPGWVEISWDEAYDILVPRLKKIRETNPGKLAVGGFHIDSFFWGNAFAEAYGTPNGGQTLMFCTMGPLCGNGPHTAGMLVHGSENTHPDVEYAEYMMVVGGGLMEAFQSAVPYARLVGDALQRGAKLVVVDPQQGRAAGKADEWVPIRPATDAAFLFGMMYTLVHELGIYDREFLKRYSNAVYLIGEDRFYLRDPESNKPLIWDPVDGVAKTYDDPSFKDFALEGSYDTPAGRGRTGFDIFKEQIRQYTPEWAAQITSIPAATIRRLAKEFGEAAKIGSTIEIDGITLPYRPASVSGYRGIGAHTNGLHSCWAMEMTNLLVGSCRGVGGARAYVGAMVPGPDGVATHYLPVTGIDVGDDFPPKSMSFKEYFPLSITNGLLHFEGQVNPEKYAFDPIDTLIFEMSNPVMAAQNPAIIIEGLKKIPFIVDLTIHLDETAEFADMILPDVTFLERWELLGLPNMTFWSVEDDGIQFQRPVVERLHKNTKPTSDVFFELAERLGILKGPKGLVGILNSRMGIPIYDSEKNYTTAQQHIEDLINASPDRDLLWKNGHALQRTPLARRYYPLALYGCRFPFYATEILEKERDVRKYVEDNKVFEKTVFDEKIFFEFAPLPFWFPSVIEDEPKEFDMYVINWKSTLGSQAQGVSPAANLWLRELTERDPYVTKILINRATASAKGLKDGEMICVESPNGKMEGRLKVTEMIHPEVIGTFACFGHYTAHAKGIGPGHYNTLLGTGFRYHGPSSLGGENAARAKIYRAGQQ